MPESHTTTLHYTKLTIAISNPGVTAARGTLGHIPGHVKLLRVSGRGEKVLRVDRSAQKHIVVEIDELLGETL